MMKLLYRNDIVIVFTHKFCIRRNGRGKLWKKSKGAPEGVCKVTFLTISSARSEIFVKVKGHGNTALQGHKKLSENLQGLFFQ